MAQLEIPVNPKSASQRMTIPLDGTRYRLQIYYSFRQEIWFMDIRTDQNVDIFVGIKLVASVSLISRFQIVGLPPGDFLVDDTSGAGRPPGRDNFGRGKTIRLLYTEEGTEVEAA